MNFVPAVVPATEEGEPAWWFVFRGDDLLIELKDKAPLIPYVIYLESLNLEPIRKQYLGTLDGIPCYSAELDAGALAPEGMAFRELRELFGLLEEGFFWVSGYANQIVNWDRTHRYCGRCGTPLKINLSTGPKLVLGVAS